MAKKAGQFKIYFHNNGDMMSREPYHSIWSGPSPTPPQYKTEDNHVFHDQMEYADYYSNGVILKSITSGRKYYMFMRHFHEVMKTKMMYQNVIEGDFTFAKHGVIQGVKMVLPKNP